MINTPAIFVTSKGKQNARIEQMSLILAPAPIVYIPLPLTNLGFFSTSHKILVIGIINNPLESIELTGSSTQ